MDGLSDSSTIVAPPTASGYSCIPANPRVQLLPNGTLRTYDLGVTDTGVYMCVANNPDEVRGTITFNVSVFCEYTDYMYYYIIHVYLLLHVLLLYCSLHMYINQFR